MKKLTKFLVILLTVICFCGCQNKSTVTNNSKNITKIMDTEEIVVVRSKSDQFHVNFNSKKIVEEYTIDLSNYSNLTVTMLLNENKIFSEEVHLFNQNDEEQTEISSSDKNFDYFTSFKPTGVEYNDKDKYKIEFKFEKDKIITLNN